MHIFSDRMDPYAYGLAHSVCAMNHHRGGSPKLSAAYACHLLGAFYSDEPSRREARVALIGERRPFDDQVPRSHGGSWLAWRDVICLRGQVSHDDATAISDVYARLVGHCDAATISQLEACVADISRRMEEEK